jgi:hypothetical protein
VEICDRVLVLRPGQEPVELRTTDADVVLDAIYSAPTTAAPIPSGASHA